MFAGFLCNAGAATALKPAGLAGCISMCLVLRIIGCCRVCRPGSHPEGGVGGAGWPRMRTRDRPAAGCRGPNGGIASIPGREGGAGAAGGTIASSCVARLNFSRPPSPGVERGGGRGGRWAAWSGPMSARCQATQAGDSQPGCPGSGEGTPVPGTPGRSDRAARLPPQRGSAGRLGWPPPFATMAHQAGTTPADCEPEQDATAAVLGLWVATITGRGGTVSRGRSLLGGTPPSPWLSAGLAGSVVS